MRWEEKRGRRKKKERRDKGNLKVRNYRGHAREKEKKDISEELDRG